MGTRSTLPWVIVARVEVPGESEFAEGDGPMTADELQQIADAYDTGFRRAPIISGYDTGSGTAGPAHFTGEYLPPLGWVRALSFDGVNLWAEMEELDGRVTAKVGEGFTDRSIGFWRETPGRPETPYLRHIALLGGEPPGVHSMPPLDEFFAEALGRAAADAPFHTRQCTGPLRTQENTMEPEKTTRTADPGHQPDAAPENPTPPQGGSGTAPSAQRTAPPAAPQAPPIPDSFQRVLEAAVTAAVKPLQDEITSLRTGQEELTKTARQATSAARSTQVRARIDEFVRSGRLMPAQAEAEVSFFKAHGDKLSDDEVDARLAVLEKLPALSGLRTATGHDIGIRTTDGETTIGDRRFSLPNGEGRVNEHGLEAVRTAYSKVASITDPEQRRLAIRQHLYAAEGETDLEGAVV